MEPLVGPAVLGAEAMSHPAEPPGVCPACGAEDAYEARYSTGGGWRIDHYRCSSCGRRTGPDRRDDGQS